MNTAAEFLRVKDQFQLGVLETEKPHPSTVDLSSLVVSDLKSAVDTLAKVDTKALNIIIEKQKEIQQLRKAIQQTHVSGGRVFMVGCGATGRLSLTLEFLWREMFPQKDTVFSLMAGGDVALVHSLEGFEDFPEYGARHLKQMGFRDGDLLIATTEGGETPYVIGATWEATKLSKVKPYFLYCNPNGILEQKVERSKEVIQSKLIEKINLCVGPMAITGSTRMQASTVLQLAVGIALLTKLEGSSLVSWINKMQEWISDEATQFLPGFVSREADEYKNGRYVMYSVRDFVITVFTDTTERAPTFSLTSFSHPNATKLLAKKPSPCYVHVDSSKDAKEAWKMLLGRAPRPLNWHDIDERTCDSYLNDFDFSGGARQFRSNLTNEAEHSDFKIFRDNNNQMIWSFLDHDRALIFPDESDLLFQHTLLKMLINIHSTLVMGLMGRYEGNLMTFVHPTNGKLIDRASRYVDILLRRDGVNVPYETIVTTLFAENQKIHDKMTPAGKNGGGQQINQNAAGIFGGESVVLNTVRALRS
jgi:N-acetylmuramic acid 6-phosphate etherase